MGNFLPRAFFLEEYNKMKGNQNSYVFESLLDVRIQPVEAMSSTLRSNCPSYTKIQIEWQHKT